MFIYNVTVNVEKEIHDEWFDWMKNTHVHDVMNTGFSSIIKCSDCLTRRNSIRELPTQFNTIVTH